MLQIIMEALFDSIRIMETCEMNERQSRLNEVYGTDIDIRSFSVLIVMYQFWSRGLFPSLKNPSKYHVFFNITRQFVRRLGRRTQVKMSMLNKGTSSSIFTAHRCYVLLPHYPYSYYFRSSALIN